MIDALWLLWSSARVDYAKAATVCLLTWCIARKRSSSDQPEALSKVSAQQ